MSNSRRKSLIEPEGWADVIVRTFVMFLVAFVALSVKEWLETRELDVEACAIDGGVIALGTFVFYACLAATSGGSRRTEDRVAMPASRRADRSEA